MGGAFGHAPSGAAWHSAWFLHEKGTRGRSWWLGIVPAEAVVDDLVQNLNVRLLASG